MIQRSLTATEFLERRGDLADGGQWAELIRGVPMHLEPPDLEHGTIVLNLSKAFSSYVHETLNGYPCFDLGIQVEKSPDTIFFPAVSYFVEGTRFAETDNEIALAVPVFVVELATTRERRSTMNDRIHAYHDHGVPEVWLIDPHQRSLHICTAGLGGNRRWNEDDTLTSVPLLPGFEVHVGHLFAPPTWA